MTASLETAVSIGPHVTVGAIVVAAGRSRRMAGVDKTLVELGGRPLISHSLDALHSSEAVGSVVLVLSEDNIELATRLVTETPYPKVTSICIGGVRRQDSVRIGLDMLPEPEWIIVHDGARPLLNAELIARGLSAALVTGVAVAAVPVKETIKAATADMLVTETLAREVLWTVQTPQVFRRDLLAQAHRLVTDDVTDDASMVERAGGKVRLYTGSYDNIKVTTPDDLLLAEVLLARAANSTSSTRG